MHCFCCRPFSIVDGVGFHNLSAKLIALGAKYGEHLKADDILPSARTVSRHVASVARTQREELREELSGFWRLAVTTDLWTHETTNTQYITVTIHYVTQEWKMKSAILATREMTEKKTAENIRTVIHGILEEFSAKRDKNYYVSDNGANVKAAFHNQQWLSCSGHNLNLAVTHALEPKHISDDSPFKPVVEMIGILKELVTRVKRTQIQSKLDTTLKQVILKVLICILVDYLKLHLIT